MSTGTQQSGHFAPVRVILTKVAPHDAVPGGVILLVELLLDVGSNVLLDVELFQGL